VPEFILLLLLVWALATPANAMAAVATAAMSTFRIMTSFGKMPMPANADFLAPFRIDTNKM
jgi:hypothetical protein